MRSPTLHLSVVPSPTSAGPAEAEKLAPTPSSPPWLDAVCREFERRLPGLFPPIELGGLPRAVAELLQPVREVVVAPLPREDKVQLKGSLLIIAPEYPLQLDSVRDPNDQLRRFSLYVAHEVAHIAQGIDDKARVEELHASGGEDTLLWLDHEADHAAARYCQAVLGTELIALRRLQLRALRAFPVALSHRPSDRQRKTRRVVDLASDIAARELGLIKPHEVAQLHWTRGGGPALVMVRGSFVRSLVSTRISSKDAGVLEAAAKEDRKGKREKKILRITGEIVGWGK